MKRWAVLALVGTLLITAWVGWDRYTKLRPQTAAVARVNAPAEAGGLRFAVKGVQKLAQIEVVDDDPLVAMPGATWVRLDFSITLLDPTRPIDDLYCTGFLVSGASEWSDEDDPSSRNDRLADSFCHSVGDDKPLTVGQVKPMVMYWLVPTWAAEAPQFFLRFSTASMSVELRP